MEPGSTFREWPFDDLAAAIGGAPVPMPVEDLQQRSAVEGFRWDCSTLGDFCLALPAVQFDGTEGLWILAKPRAHHARLAAHPRDR